MCGGEVEAGEWVLDWLAHLVQRPWEKPSSAFAMQGRQGCGKGTVIDAMEPILGSYLKRVHNIDELLSENFNASIMQDALLVFLDESVWSGNKSTANRLKALISENSHKVNEKFMPSYSVDSYLRVVLAVYKR